MTPELTALSLAALLQILQIALYSVAGQMQLGLTKALSPRDTPVVLGGKPGRIQRAMDNHFEGLLLFTIACLVLTFSDKATAFTGLAAFVYVLARILYIPAYIFGLVPWRSAIWLVGLLCTAYMLGVALL